MQIVNHNYADSFAANNQSTVVNSQVPPVRENNGNNGVFSDIVSK